MAYTGSYGELGDQELEAAVLRAQLARFGLTVEVVLLGIVAGELSVLLVRRTERPAEGGGPCPATA